MMREAIVCCTVALYDGKETYSVQSRHYDELRDRLDRQETGWVELDSIWGDGKALIRLESITDLFLCTASFVEERNAFEQRMTLGGGE